MLLFRFVTSGGSQGKFLQTLQADCCCYCCVTLWFNLIFWGLRLDELRHRLIPLYSYDPTEDREWEDDSNENEDEELNVSEPMNVYFMLL